MHARKGQGHAPGVVYAGRDALRFLHREGPRTDERRFVDGGAEVGGTGAHLHAFQQQAFFQFDFQDELFGRSEDELLAEPGLVADEATFHGHAAQGYFFEPEQPFFIAHRADERGSTGQGHGGTYNRLARDFIGYPSADGLGGRLCAKGRGEEQKEDEGEVFLHGLIGV